MSLTPFSYGGDVAVFIEHRAQIQHAAVHAVAGQLAGVLGHRVDDAVAVGELRQRAIGVVAGIAGEGGGAGLDLGDLG